MGADPQAGIAGSVHAAGGRDTSAEEVAQATLDAIERSDHDVLAFTAVDPERVLADARVLDERMARGIAPGPLWGVPVAVKDVIDVEGLPTSYGTRAAPERAAMRDAFCVARLREAGALVVGKTRTSELAWRGDTPPTRNPRWPRLIPGGSSGGSAAAVAAGHVTAALGTDTGGSVRWPAVMCGLVGLKPTYGAISLQGVSPCSWSLDHVGVLAHSIEDVRRLLRALVWPDPAEARSAPARLLEPLAACLAERRAGSLLGRTLGVLDEDAFAFADPARAARFEELLSELPSTGAAVVKLRLPLVRYASPAVTAISLADGVRLSPSLRADLLSDEVRAQLQLAQLIPAPLVTRAQQVRAQLARDVAHLFREHELDALLTPAMTAPPLTREELEARGGGADGKGRSGLAWGARTFYLASLTGQPAAILPLAGVDGPDAVQLIGRPFADDDLLALAETLENGLALRSIPTMDRPSPTR